MSTLKPSEALAAGIELRPQDLHMRYISESGACALGAIWIGAGLDAPEDSAYSVKVAEAYPELTQMIPCPECNDRTELTIINVINGLYELHKWSRKRIADWLTAQGL